MRLTTDDRAFAKVPMSNALAKLMRLEFNKKNEEEDGEETMPKVREHFIYTCSVFCKYTDGSLPESETENTKAFVLILTSFLEDSFNEAEWIIIKQRHARSRRGGHPRWRTAARHISSRMLMSAMMARPSILDRDSQIKIQNNSNQITLGHAGHKAK